jgi:putative transposase
MGRSLRPTSADVVYHVLNRANARRTLFDDDGDYAAFERVLTQACERVSMRLLEKKKREKKKRGHSALSSGLRR